MLSDKHAHVRCSTSHNFANTTTAHHPRTSIVVSFWQVSSRRTLYSALHTETQQCIACTFHGRINRGTYLNELCKKSPGADPALQKGYRQSNPKSAKRESQRSESHTIRASIEVKINTCLAVLRKAKPLTVAVIDNTVYKFFLFSFHFCRHSRSASTFLFY